MDDDDDDDALKAPSDHDNDDAYPSIHHGNIIETYIAGVGGNFNDDDDDNNTNDDNTNVHDDAEININNNDKPKTNCADTNDNTDVLQLPNDAITEHEETNDNYHETGVLNVNY